MPGKKILNTWMVFTRLNQMKAEIHAADDTKRREEIEARNNADSMAYNAEKLLRDNKDKVPSDLNQEAESKVAAVKSALQGTDIDTIRRSTQELSDTMQKIGTAIYQQQPPPGEEPPPPGEQPPPGQEGQEGGEGGEGGEGTVEGEFREV